MINTSIFKILNYYGLYQSIISVFVSAIITIILSIVLYKIIKMTYMNKILFYVKKEETSIKEYA